ncbi:hypothetical protein JW835_14030 [bacterium]|nr:hypothetical protein [bacterium]
MNKRTVWFSRINRKRNTKRKENNRNGKFYENGFTLTMNPAIDIITSIENVAAERKLHCHALRYDPGGGGINVSRAIHRLGGKSRAVYPSGAPTSRMLEQMLEKEGI